MNETQEQAENTYTSRMLEDWTFNITTALETAIAPKLEILEGEMMALASKCAELEMRAGKLFAPSAKTDCLWTPFPYLMSVISKFLCSPAAEHGAVEADLQRVTTSFDAAYQKVSDSLRGNSHES